MPASPVHRPNARVLLVDARDRVLLFRWVDPRLDVPALWITPGGGVQAGESWEQAALRELREETGLHGVTLGPCVWRRRLTFAYSDQSIDSDERFFLARVDAHVVDGSGMEPAEAAYLDAARWWSVPELEAAGDEVFAPPNLAVLMPPLLAGVIPTQPLELDR